MDTTNINLNAAECIKSASNIGSTIYTNICNGTTQTVAWGSADWLGAVAMGGLSLLLLGVFAFIGFKIFQID